MQLGKSSGIEETVSNLKNPGNSLLLNHKETRRLTLTSSSKVAGPNMGLARGADLEESILHTHVAFHDTCVGKPLRLMRHYPFLVTLSACTVKSLDAICIFSDQLHPQMFVSSGKRAAEIAAAKCPAGTPVI